MAVLAACASTNFTTATTWALVDSATYNDLETSAATPPTSAGTTSRGAARTPAAVTLDGIGVFLGTRTGTTGTITVSLVKSSDNTLASADTTLAVNMSSLPNATSGAIDGGWVFFKWPATFAPDGATAYKVNIITSSATQVTIWGAASNDWKCYLRTTTTQAPAAGDNLIITKEWTAAATGTARTVTMDNTATTDFGSAPSAANGLLTPGIHISNGGTLNWDGTVNSYLRMSNSIIIYNGGEMDMGTVATPVLRTKTAKLFFDCAADGDYGLLVRGQTSGQTGGTFVAQGLSRTIGKTAVSTKLTLDMPVANKLIIGTTAGQGIVTTTNTTVGTGTSIGVDGYSLLANGVTDSATNAYHSVATGGVGSTTNQKYFCSCWIARGSGTNNRYVRLQFGNTGAAALTNGFYADFDLSAVTASAYTNVGNGAGDGTDVATITAAGAGFLCTISGKGSTAAVSNIFGIAACSAAATPSYAGDSTQAFILQGPKVFELTYTPTITIATPGVVTATAHGLGVGAAVVFTTSGALPTGITASTTYYVCGGANLQTNTFTIATSLANAQAQPPTEIATSGSQSGAHTLTITAPTGTLTVADDTGWLSGDTIAVASTSRTFTDCEPMLLTSAATATTLPCTVPLTGGIGPAAHSGSSPTQAEVILLTRNVVVAGFNSTLMTYVFCDLTSVVDIDWTEFYYLGINSATKRGIEVATTTGSFAMSYSSIHDTEVNGIFCTGVSLNNVTINYNMMWYAGTVTGPSAQINLATSGTSITIDNNILVRNGAGNGWTMSDVGGTFTNNTVAGSANVGINATEAASFGTFSGNTVHSSVSNGFTIGAAIQGGTLSTTTSWRNSGNGISFTGNAQDVILNGVTAFGNLTTNISFSGAVGLLIKTPVVNGDTSFGTTNGMSFTSTGPIQVSVFNGDLSTVSGIMTAHTTDIFLNSALNAGSILLSNTKLGAATEVSGVTLLSNKAYVSSQKHDGTAGLHKTWTKYGATTGGLVIDNVIYNTATPSLRCIPTNASSKLESAPPDLGTKVAIASGATCTVSVYVRKSIASDSGGVLYAGAQPRLIQRANPALGQNSDVVIATMTVADNSGTWEQLTGASSTATGDDGVWEFIVDCTGTNGAWINVDDWAISTTDDVRGEKYWSNGLGTSWVPPTPSAGGGGLMINPGLSGGLR